MWKADGASQEMDIFLSDARTACDEILSYAPFNTLKERFNFIAVMLPSQDSGVSVPQDGVWKSTALGSNFMTFYSPRYLTTNNVHQMHDLISGIPCEHIIILANTTTYGGGGIYNSYTLTTAHNPMFKPVVVHEFGHSFAGLGDEYFYEQIDHTEGTYDLSYEPWEQNITSLVDFKSKWEDMLPAGYTVPTEPTDERKANYTVGVYEGGGYITKGITELSQDHGADLLGRIFLSVNDGMPVCAHVPFHGADGTATVDRRLTQGGIAHQPFTVLRKGYHTGSGASAFFIRNNNGSATFNHTDTAIGSTQINTDCLAHNLLSFPLTS